MQRTLVSLHPNKIRFCFNSGNFSLRLKTFLIKTSSDQYLLCKQPEVFHLLSLLASSYLGAAAEQICRCVCVCLCARWPLPQPVRGPLIVFGAAGCAPRLVVEIYPTVVALLRWKILFTTRRCGHSRFRLSDIYWLTLVNTVLIMDYANWDWKHTRVHTHSSAFYYSLSLMLSLITGKQTGGKKCPSSR